MTVKNIIVYENWNDALTNNWKNDFGVIFDSLDETIKECQKFYTRDVNLLDLDLLRQDEIRFMNRGNQGESYIKSLNDYNVRFDKKLLRKYLIGEYGGVLKF